MLNDTQRQRYSRNIASIGEEAQTILLESKVLIIGIGGLGSPVLHYLSAVGIGEIGIIDSDRVALDNLQRQVIYDETMIGRCKVNCAREKINKLNYDVKINAYNKAFDATNAQDMISQYDIIIDCSDNFETRFLLNRVCYNAQKPFVSGAAVDFQGYAAIFKSNFPCYQCFCAQIPDKNTKPNCISNGIIGSITGIIGGLQAQIAICEILDIGCKYHGYLFRFNGLNFIFNKTQMVKDPKCPICR